MSEKQTVNAGGTLKPEDVVGRDAFIRSSWRTLENQGLYITGERRIGKSSIIRDKMGREPMDGRRLIYLDVSDADTPLAFVDGLFREAKKHLGTSAKLKLGAIEVFQKLAPDLEIAKVVKLPANLAPHWKDLLRVVLADFEASEVPVVLAFDEMPLMLDKIKRNEGEVVAMDVLDTLRKERQGDKRLRMIYTGSLGLHHVLADLQSARYQNSPMNDLKQVEVEPLSSGNATELAARLLRGMEVVCADHDALAAHLARITCGMPFYIQNLVSDLAERDEECTVVTADQLLTRRLTDPGDAWDLGYYVRRIETHYQPANKLLALAFLDYLATTQTPQTLEQIVSGVDPKRLGTKKVVDVEAAQRTVELLGRDHYTAQEEDGTYRFRYSVIARAWGYKRQLSAQGKRG